MYDLFFRLSPHHVMPLIALEGPDGSGTTYHTKQLTASLRSRGIDAISTMEPTDGTIGSFVRARLSDEKPLSPTALQLLFTADRAWHIDTVLAPALREGKTVVCDRYISSTLVYGSIQGLDDSWLRRINETFPQPDKLILCLPPLAVCLERISMRPHRDFFEQKHILTQVYASYAALAANLPPSCVVDTSSDKEQVAKIILSAAEI